MKKALICCLLLLAAPVYGQAPQNFADQRARIFTVRPAQQQILLTGFTRARATLDIIPEVAGRCLEITADLGETIGNNGIFAVIDSTLVHLDLKANSVSRQQVQRNLRFETQQVKRYQQLHTSKSSSQARLDEQQLLLDQSRLKLDQLQVEAERLQELLSRHTIKAPPGWRIVERHVEPGQWVPGGRILAKAGDYQTLIVPLAVTPSQLRSLQREKPIPLHLPGEDIDGHGSLHRISPGFDSLTRKIKIEILIDRKTYDNLSLKQGGVRVEVPVQIPDPMHGFLVPARAVIERYEESWLTRKNGKQVPIIVLGLANGPDDDSQWMRITSTEIKAGDSFKLPPAQ
ncbi:MAG: HlyD family efflux transporter periplasmic adaptor subunit [Deltaproteobacteria bacterium]|nr:HlyD family efflux transporter periplasmic adaptor subunit [Deltaproteobacteria bacterium]